jgi:translation elongation factor EF-Tu-like GTPase
MFHAIPAGGFLAMQQKDVYLDLVAGEVRELVSRVALAKKSFAKLRVSVKVEHLRELEQVRNHCSELQRLVEELQERQDRQLEQTYAAVEIAWNQSMDAVDTLLRGLS